jgi:hypothetical protein
MSSGPARLFPGIASARTALHAEVERLPFRGKSWKLPSSLPATWQASLRRRAFGPGVAELALETPGLAGEGLAMDERRFEITLEGWAKR